MFETLTVWDVRYDPSNGNRASEVKVKNRLLEATIGCHTLQVE